MGRLMGAYDLLICDDCGCKHKVPIEALGKVFICSRCGAEMPTEEPPIALEAGSVQPVGRGASRARSAVAGAEPAGAPKRRMGELLVEAGLVTQEQLEEALMLQKEQGGKVAEKLIGLEYLDMRDFVDFLSRQPGVASIDLFNYQIPEDLPGLIPREFALKHEVIPLDRMGKHLTVAMACPLDTMAIRELEALTGMKVKALLCSVNDIRVGLRR
ncbi:MAG TPA: hypothetical protein ENN80_11935, partial [Candidatus Hydrogenedentes bacterium]|nr:hypothetical protein [Candidatus Hydrogenedentota bacterium]